MKNKQRIIQICLSSITTFVIIEFYSHDALEFPIKVIAAMSLIVLNVAHNYWIGLQDGIKMSEEHEAYMKELKEENYNKIINMVVEEKK